MEKTFMDIIRSLLPLGKKHKANFAQLQEVLTQDQLTDLRYLVKTKKVGIVSKKQQFGKKKLTNLIELHTLTEEQPVIAIIKDFNRIITTKTMQINYETFAASAKETILPLIAPNLLGMEEAKEAALLQLFSTERAHILLLGDPGTGKTDLLRSAAQLAPISSFGLGSGTSGVGLSVTIEGNAIKKGLLTKADKGICCIDELNLMKKEDRAALYSAMEKGFVSYDKGGKHKKIPAAVRVFATANPQADRFIGKAVSLLRQQLPFDSALLTRFHLVFIFRKPDAKGLAEISKQIVRHKPTNVKDEDVEFIKGYVAYALETTVTFPDAFEADVTAFIKEAKEDEEDYLIEIGPRTVHGIIRLAQAHARMELRSEVEGEDLDAALRIMKASFHVPGTFERKKTINQSYYGKGILDTALDDADDNSY